ncbi:helix-turn-helix domain-containing protein [Streptacidiphilus carbonis]|uniref:helix-turn-helix domain-containing protein n=1 Tax=Streptacidiphilus carbonis TaxID=105422 RepID=UPI000693CD60|nr:helix-turn-helix domain-containing protein [Streptacidiphilus carbonis]
MSAPTFAPCCGVLPRLWVPVEQQWMEMTGGRVAPDGYSWLQAVHWVVASGCYVPVRSHGPREMGRTSVRLAQELAQLSPCRPGVEYLARRLKVTERTVEYHLSMLRESGLLVYLERGTRVRGERARASEFALVIPAAFDAALGIRTAGDGTGRRMTGIAEAGRELMARMGAKAAKKWRAARPRRSTKTPPTAAGSGVDQADRTVQHSAPQEVSGASGDDSRCTPMEGGVPVCISDGPSIPPSESKLGAGQVDLSTGEKRQQEWGAKPKRRIINKVGRRHQLAFELVQQVPWMTRAAVPRVAWVVRHVADAGWSVNEVIAWLELGAASSQVRRPSAYLAHRLRGALQVWSTQAQRDNGVAAWRDTRRSTADRHVEWDGAWQPPRSMAVRRKVQEAMRAPVLEVTGATLHGADDQVPLEDLTREEVLGLRDLARNNPDLIRMAIEAQGEAYARRLYTHAVVEQLIRIPAQGARMVVHSGWGQQW